ncbi:60S acidic ribosomal protein P2 [Blastocystis sp. ATCC 50177/Nand II]|uniref:60S acidic ribosomal protein P2 n=1 Tax=Blastocystis sp. subtype 1 (strain ATCC 50177 / NandII) TaxID=478820 RepID=A0A196SHP8_BLAHN|nr:60S acidic ribosomal protein P2 [Blastocystis sp. ATCC 50177/Nand II]OAO14291.1 60S acidic ribosomal protein P2 [Blastocystis sp. ATCC 50177/Nand II]OAO15489.1 60S acidic ribosomal protein P2 [Blastocystis sp. ATCC 50177/Nand II]
MRHLSAYLMLVLGGNEKPTAENIKTVLESVGAEAEDEKIEKLLADLEGKNVEEMIKEGLEKLVSIPTGGAAAPAAGAAAPAEEKKEEEKKEEEEEEEEDVDMSGGGLFGGDDDDW